MGKAQAGQVSAQRKAALLQCVSSEFGVSVDELLAPNRLKQPVCFARQVAMYLCNTFYGHSIHQTGRALGRHYTTVSHALHLIEDARDQPDIDRRIAAIEGSLMARDGAKGDPICLTK